MLVDPHEYVPPSREDVVAYIDGSSDGVASSTAGLNVEAWRRWSIRPRTLRAVGEVDTTTSVLGAQLPVPIIAAPWQNHLLAHPEGEVASARAARAAGVGFALSMGSSRIIEDVAAVSGPFLQQVYLPEDRSRIDPFLERCVEAGAYAFAITVDTPPVSIGAGFRVGVAEQHRRSSPNFAWDDLRPRGSLGLDDVSWLVGRTTLPVLTKGILRADDALRAVGAGASGVVVSNHGGRQVDGAITTAEVLPEVVDALDGATVLVDGGVRRPEDVVRALALGASAVLVGQPAARALLKDGEDGLTRYFRDLVEGFRRQMVLCGVGGVADFGSDLVRWRPWG